MEDGSALVHSKGELRRGYSRKRQLIGRAKKKTDLLSRDVFKTNTQKYLGKTHNLSSFAFLLTIEL